MTDPVAPCWVQAVRARVMGLDPVDAANWLEAIADVVAQRADEALAAGLAAGKGEKREIKKTPAHLKRFS